MQTWPVFPRGKIQWNKCFVSTPSLSCGGISPLPLWEMVQKQTATGQDVVTLSLHYLQPTSQTLDHNNCLSHHSLLYLWVSCLLSSCDTADSNGVDGHKKKKESTRRQKCISCCYCCVLPAGINSDQRPFIIWRCQNIKLSVRLSVRTKYKGSRGRTEAGIKKMETQREMGSA